MIGKGVLPGRKIDFVADIRPEKRGQHDSGTEGVHGAEADGLNEIAGVFDGANGFFAGQAPVL